MEMIVARVQRPLVLVKWKDIISKDDWLKVSEAEKTHPQLFISVGWLLSRSKECLVMTSCYSPEDDTVGAVLSIPTGTLVSVKKLPHYAMPKERSRPTNL
jgi:hypothetical protein